MESAGFAVATGGVGRNSNVLAVRSAGDGGQVRTDKEVVLSLLKQLRDASDEKSPKPQTAQNVRNQLNEIRGKLGEDEYKKIIEQIKKEIAESWLQLLMRLFPELFPDESSPSPSPPKPVPIGSGNHGGNGHGNGVRGNSVNPSDFGSVDSMSNKPFTKGAGYTAYKPDKSNPGKKPGMGNEADNIWTGFKQGPDGNCTTVAAIKAAMMQFGKKPTDVFKDVRASGDGYDVQMRDGKQYHLSRHELQQAAQQARFEGTDPEMITNANFMYAVSAKRAHVEGNQGFGHGNDHNARRSYQDALVSLNDGERPDEVLDRLGLKGLYRKSSSDELASGALGVVAYNGHTMAVIGGHTELWGGRGGRPAKEDWNWGGAYAFI